MHLPTGCDLHHARAVGSELKRVVIVGGGFAGLNAAKLLGASGKVDVWLIDRRNHHLFQPLLYQVAMAGLSPAEIARPIRSLLSDQSGRTGTVTISAPVAAATRPGSLVLPVPEMPARITKGLARTAATNAATCHGSNKYPLAATNSMMLSTREDGVAGGDGAAPVVGLGGDAAGAAGRYAVGAAGVTL